MKFFVIFITFIEIYASSLKIIDINITQNISSFRNEIKLIKPEHLLVNILVDDAYQKTSNEYNETDIVLLIDNTSSMNDLIALIKFQMNDISSFIFKNYSNSKIAIATISEHTNPMGSNAYKIIQNFTDDSHTLEKSLNYLKVDDINNTDYEEAYLYGLSESLKLQWRQKSQKILLFVGDAWGHNPDPGKDKKLNTKDDLYLDDVIDKFREKKIRICAYYKNEYKDTEKYFKQLSQKTQGFSTAIKKDRDLQYDLQGILQNVTNMHYKINIPFHKKALVIQKNNNFKFDFDLNPLKLNKSRTINIILMNNGREIGKSTVYLVFGRPWGLFYIIGSVLFLLVCFITLNYIYNRDNMTTTIDYGYLHHYFIFFVAIILYGLMMYFSWYVMNQASFPIIWHRFWW